MSTFFSRSTLSWSLSCPAHHLEWTDNKPFSELIGPNHIKSRAVVHQNYNFAKAFEPNTIYLTFTFQKPSKQ